jgi:hypothetical protein
MKKNPLLLILCLLAGATLRADQAPTRAEIDQLMTVSQTESIYNNTLKSMKGMINQMIPGMLAQMKTSPDVSGKVTALADKISDIMQNAMSWDKMKDQYAQVYAEVYSPDEIKQLIDFYNGPTGQMYLNTAPQLLQKSEEVAMQEASAMVSSVQGGGAASPTPMPAPPNRPDLEELMTVSRVTQLTQGMFGKVAAMEQQRAAASGTAGAAMASSLQALTNPDNIKGMYETILGSVYTPDQVKQMIDFYKSPTGQMFLDKMPVVTQKTMVISQQMMMNLLPQIQQAVQQTMEAPSPSP